MLEEVLRFGVDTNGGVEDAGDGVCRELEEAPTEGRKVLRASFCFSSCNLA